MLTPLAWLKETDTVATHAQAKRDITHSAGYTVHVYPYFTELQHIMLVPKQLRGNKTTNVEKSHTP